MSMHRTTTTDDDDTRRLSLALALALAVLLGFGTRQATMGNKGGLARRIFVERASFKLEDAWIQPVDGMSFVRFDNWRRDNCQDERRCARAMRRSTFGRGGEGIPSQTRTTKTRSHPLLGYPSQACQLRNGDGARDHSPWSWWWPRCRRPSQPQGTLPIQQ